MPPVLAVVGAVSAVASTVQQHRAAKAQERQQAVATRESRRQAIRQAQLQRSSVLASAAGLGAAGSSVQGGMSSLGSQLGGQLGFSSEMSGLSQRITRLQASAATLNSASNLAFGASNYLRSGQAPGGQSGGGSLYPSMVSTFT